MATTTASSWMLSQQLKAKAVRVVLSLWMALGIITCFYLGLGAVNLHILSRRNYQVRLSILCKSQVYMSEHSSR